MYKTIRADESWLPPEIALDTERGRDIGDDFARLGMHLPESAEEAVREGYTAGLHRYGARTAPSTIWDRKLVRLRYSAWRRNRVVDPSLTPDYIRSIQVTHCPITRQELTFGTGQGSDATIDRVFNAGAYSPGNLVVMSAKSNFAKANRLPDEIYEIAQRGSPFAGLEPIEWRRIASLASSAAPPGTTQYGFVPLLVMPPRDLILANMCIVVQVALSVIAGGFVNPRHLAPLAAAAGSGKRVQQGIRKFMHVLSVRINHHLAVHAQSPVIWWGIEDAWAEAPLWDAFIRLMNDFDRDALIRMTAASSKVGKCVQRRPGNAHDSWALDTGGYVREESVHV